MTNPDFFLSLSQRQGQPERREVGGIFPPTPGDLRNLTEVPRSEPNKKTFDEIERKFPPLQSIGEEKRRSSIDERLNFLKENEVTRLSIENLDKKFNPLTEVEHREMIHAFDAKKLSLDEDLRRMSHEGRRFSLDLDRPRRRSVELVPPVGTSFLENLLPHRRLSIDQGRVRRHSLSFREELPPPPVIQEKEIPKPGEQKVNTEEN